MTERGEVFDAICAILRSEVRCEAALEPSTDLLGDAALDSIDLLTLTVELENHFEIALEDVEVSDALPIDTLVDHVLRHLTERDAGGDADLAPASARNAP